MGSTWVLSAPDGPHVDSMNLAIRESNQQKSAVSHEFSPHNYAVCGLRLNNSRQRAALGLPAKCFINGHCNMADSPLSLSNGIRGQFIENI